MSEERFTITEDGLYLLGEGKAYTILALDNISPDGGAAAWDLGGGSVTLNKYIGNVNGGDVTNAANFSLVADVSLSTAPSLERKFGSDILAILVASSTNPDLDVEAKSVRYYGGQS